MQLGQVVKDIDKQMEVLCRDFGFSSFDVHRFDSNKIHGSEVWGKPSSHSYLSAACWKGDIQFEIMQPLEGSSIYSEFMEKHKGEGLQHFKIIYSDAQAKVAELKNKGYRVMQSGEIGNDVFYAIDSENQTLGVTIEIGNNATLPTPDRTYPPEAAPSTRVERPLEDGDLMQIAHVTSDLEATMNGLYHDFGIGPFDVFYFSTDMIINPTYRGKPGKFTFRCANALSGGIQYQVLQPLTGDSIYSEHLKEHGDGLHHFKLYYNDVDKKVKEYESKGYSVLQSGRANGDKFFYLDTAEKCGGVIIEIGNAGELPPLVGVYPAKK